MKCKLSPMQKKLPLTPIETDAVLYVIISVLLLISVNQVFAQSEMLRDINQNEDTYYNEYSSLTGGPQRLYFVSEGKNLYASQVINGQEETFKIKGFSLIRNLRLIGSALYFSADDGKTGLELWKSDGTEAGTVQVKDIRAGSSASNPENLIDVNGTLFFIANNGTNGKEVWKSNGTASGTSLVKDIFPKAGSSNPVHLTNVNGILFFAANDGTHGYELWKTDGTSAGTTLLKDIRAEAKVSSSPDKLAAAGDVLFFSAQDPIHGRELWKSDGTAEGTVLVKDIRAGTSASNIDNTTGMNGVAYFTATDGISGQELWRSDGTEAGTYLLKDMTPGAAGSHGEVVFSHKMGNFKAINNYLFYTAYASDNYYIWKSDGTTEGTVVVEPCHGPGIGQPRPQFTLIGNSIFYFNTESDYYTYGLSRMNADGTAPQIIYELSIDGYDYDYPLVAAAGNFFYFATRADYYSTGFTIFRTTPETNQTRQLAVDTYQGTQGSNPANFTRVNGKVLFSVSDSWWNENLYVTDGTPEGTIHLDNIYADAGVQQILTAGNKAYVSFNNSLEIWQTDGTPGGTSAVAQEGSLAATNLQLISGNLFYNNAYGELWKINTETYERSMLKDFYNVTNSVALGSTLLVTVATENSGEELWRSNGTTSGTYRYKTIRSGFAYPAWMKSSATIKNTHFFIANDGIHGNELWRTQGSAASTYMVADLNPNDESFKVYNYNEFDIAAMTAFRDSLYFSAVDASGTWSLFKTNGTASGIRKIANLNSVQSMIPIGKEKMLMFVFRNNDRSTVDLWVTNGTASGTKLLNALGTLFYPTIDHEIINNEVLFMLGDGMIWKSDGTECGTYPTSLGRYTQKEFASTGNYLIFSADQYAAGLEPHRFDINQIGAAPCEATLTAMTYGEAEILTSMESMVRQSPNPFLSDFALTVSGEENELADVEVYTMSGMSVESMRSLPCNVEHRFGSNWKTGMYILKINRSGRLHTEKVIKR